MTTIFVDTAYWVARTNRQDQWHQDARRLASRLTDSLLLTTELVLTEYLSYFSSFGAMMREKTTNGVQDVLSNPRIQVVWQTQSLFLAGLDRYKARLDKGYSLTDCVSMVVMQQEGISEVLTHDKHFAQEGFTILL